MNIFFIELAAVLVLAGFIAVLVSFFKQPSIIAYIITGLIVGPLGYYHLQQHDVFDALGQIGITLLLFMVGLELDISQLKKMGKSAFLVGVGQVVFTSLIGFGIATLLGFKTMPALLISLALTFSSTIIVVKLLSEKHDLQSLYGKLVIGILLAQDLVAILLLIGLASFVPGSDSLYGNLPLWQNIMLIVVRGLILGLGILWLSSKAFPKILKYIGKSDELVLVFALAWALGLAVFVSLPFMGFSLEIGGFLAGLALAGSALHYEISARMKSLRDFFIILFFIVLGSQLMFANPGAIAMPAIVLSLFVLIGNPLIVMIVIAFLGYKPRTGVLAGVAIAQVSEFSLILMALGSRAGILSGAEVSLVTLVAIITISVSSYMILYSAQLYEFLKPFLGFFDFRRGIAEKGLHDLVLKNHIVLVGAHRLGHHLVDVLVGQKKNYVIVDFNPEVVEKYLKKGYSAICGDISDHYIQQEVKLGRARLIISTVPDINDNMALISAVKKMSAGQRVKPKLVFLAQDEAEAKYFYEQEIDYVVSPHFMSGLHLAKILEADDLKGLKKLRESHLKALS